MIVSHILFYVQNLYGCKFFNQTGNIVNKTKDYCELLLPQDLSYFL